MCERSWTALCGVELTGGQRKVQLLEEEFLLERGLREKDAHMSVSNGSHPVLNRLKALRSHFVKAQRESALHSHTHIKCSGARLADGLVRIRNQLNTQSSHMPRRTLKMRVSLK